MKIGVASGNADNDNVGCEALKVEMQRNYIVCISACKADSNVK